jgi:uncharacterized protein YciW
MDFVNLGNLLIHHSKEATNQVLQSLQDKGVNTQDPWVVQDAQILGLAYATAYFLIGLQTEHTQAQFDQWLRHAEQIGLETNPAMATAIRQRLERLYRRPNGNENADESQGS